MGYYDLNYGEEMKQAEAGDLDAMFNVASYIIWGDRLSPVEPEMAEVAIKYYMANIMNGDTDSMLDLGAMYLEGRGVRKDESKALEWYQKAAELGAKKAFRCIGNFYRYDVIDDGTPVPTCDLERLRQALDWYQKGAERGEENCLYELGDFYRYGIIIEKDEDEAFSLYQEALDVITNYVMYDDIAINDSYSDVCLRLAECYHYGIGTAVDVEKAKYFIEIAKVEAKRRLDDGDMYGGSMMSRINQEWLKIGQEAGF